MKSGPDAMKPLGSERTHYWLALGMAKAAGVDLQAAIDEGRFNQREWARSVERCRACLWEGECATWTRDTSDADAPPETCANARIFRDLKKRQACSQVEEMCDR